VTDRQVMNRMAIALEMVLKSQTVTPKIRKRIDSVLKAYVDHTFAPLNRAVDLSIQRRSSPMTTIVTSEFSIEKFGQELAIADEKYAALDAQIRDLRDAHPELVIGRTAFDGDRVFTYLRGYGHPATMGSFDEVKAAIEARARWAP
jgi:hypothetical protein